MPHDEFPGEVKTMGKFCEVCEKGLMPGHNVSIAAVQAQRETMLLDFTLGSTLTVDTECDRLSVWV